MNTRELHYIELMPRIITLSSGGFQPGVATLWGLWIIFRRATIQALALQPAVWGISCLVLLPSPCNDSACTYSFSNICKATRVTHTKRIHRNLLRKETSFVCYTSSVLRKSRHMRQKKKLRTVAQIKTQDYKNWRLQKLKITKFFHNCNSSTKHSHNTVQRTQIATAIRHFWLTKHALRV